MPQPTVQPTWEPSWSRLTAPAAQALRWPAISLPSSRPSSCAANRDAGQRSPWRPLNRIGPQGPARRVRTSSPGASNTLTASAPGTYKEEHWGCLASLNTGAGPVAAPRSPPRGNLPTTPYPRWTSSALGQPSTPPSGYPGQPSIASWQIISRTTNPSRDQLFYSHCSSISNY